MFAAHELIVEGFLLFYQLSYRLVSSLDLLAEYTLELNVFMLEDAYSILGAVKFIRSTHSAIVHGSSFLLADFVKDCPLTL